MAVGGDILEITYSHPTLGEGRFYPKANEGNTLDIGGIRSTDDASMITASGSMIDQMNRVRGSLEALCENDMAIRNDINIVRQLASDPVPTDFTASIINGSVWAFSGKPVGDISADVNASTFTLKVAFALAEKIA